MPKRRKLLTPMKKKSSAVKIEAIITKEVSTPRGRLKGALLEVLEPSGYDSETSLEQTPIKRERNVKQAQSSDDEERTRLSLPRQSYVLKLFDRSVDLSQFEEDSPLYPICRAWMINQPKTNYHAIMGMKTDNNIDTTDKIELPGPEGPSVSRIPELLPEQQRRSKDNINLNYREVTLPRKDHLLQEHLTRWGGVRRAWLQQAARVEARYQATQEVLNTINTAL